MWLILKILHLKILNLGFDYFFLITGNISFTERVCHESKTSEQWGLCTWLFLVFPLIFLSQCAVISAEAVTQNRESKKSEPYVNYGLWVIVMCQCRFISCNKWNTLVGDVDNRGGYACLGQGVYRKPLDLPLNLAANLKLLQKK